MCVQNFRWVLVPIITFQMTLNPWHGNWHVEVTYADYKQVKDFFSISKTWVVRPKALIIHIKTQQCKYSLARTWEIWGDTIFRCFVVDNRNKLIRNFHTTDNRTKLIVIITFLDGTQLHEEDVPEMITCKDLGSLTPRNLNFIDVLVRILRMLSHFLWFTLWIWWEIESTYLRVQQQSQTELISQ